MTNEFVFLRHGQYPGKGLSKSEKQKAPLSDLGQTQARDAGRFLAGWLQEHSLVVGRVVFTPNYRTRHTAEIVLAEIGVSQAPRALEETGGNNLDALLAKVDRWAQPLGSDEVLVFVGSGNSLGRLCKALGPNIDGLARKHGSVLVYRRSEAGAPWSLVDFHPRKG